MSESLIIGTNASKQEKYETLHPQIEALISYEQNLTANLANVSAALHEVFGWWWVGFYIVESDELVLGPFQGPIACTRIRFGRGVCGTAWKEAKSKLVPDVERFPGHIACSSASVSEIVVPIIDKNGKVLAVLDVDSERFDVLDETDVHYLEKLAAMVAEKF
ncbi:MAG: GAF domain-containing protein [Paludibacteraceae bacterium]|nr:GAF domain-containing protein [Paludibacteraceae bacterium]